MKLPPDWHFTRLHDPIAIATISWPRGLRETGTGQAGLLLVYRMASLPISPAVRRIILESIDSVPELEAILLMRQTLGQYWNADKLGARLYVSPTVAAYTLNVLHQRGFVQETPEGYTYAPESPALAETISELSQTYASNLIAVTQLIHSKPSAGMQDFARAFQLRKER